MAEDFFKRFDAEMQRRHPAPVAAEVVSGAAVPAATAPGTDDASGKTPTWVWVAGAVVLAVLAVWVLR